MLQKTAFLFSQAYVQVTRLTGHKSFVILLFTFAIMASYLVLLELRHVGWDFSGERWFIRLSSAWPTDILQLLYLTIKAFATTTLKSSNDMTSPNFHINNMTVYM